jgi:hypothetical protein
LHKKYITKAEKEKRKSTCVILSLCSDKIWAEEVETI